MLRAEHHATDPHVALHVSMRCIIIRKQSVRTCAQVSRGHRAAGGDPAAQQLPAAGTAAGRGPTKFAPILFDFRYFKDPDAHEARLDASRELSALDEEFREVGALPDQAQPAAYTLATPCMCSVLRASSFSRLINAQ